MIEEMRPPWPFARGRQDLIDYLRRLEESPNPDTAFLAGFVALLDYIDDREISAAACALRNRVYAALSAVRFPESDREG